MEKMPLKSFLESVEQQLLSCSIEELRAILRNMAQQSAPGERAAFLQKLQPPVDPLAAEPGINPDELLDAIAELEDELSEAMENAEPDESDDEWYGEGSDDYEDPYEEFLEPIARLFDQAQAAFDYGNLALARDAYQALFELCNEEDDYGRGIQTQQIENLDQEESLARYVFAVYSLTPAEQRAEQLFDALGQVREWNGKRLLFSQVIQISLSPLPDLDTFWPEWITFLKAQDDAHASAWLREAVRVSQGTEGLAALARGEGTRHPKAYMDWLEKLAEEQRRAEVLAGAQEALQALPKNLTIRADIADILCEMAIQLKDDGALRTGRWEAFLADPSELRLLDVWDVTPVGERLAQMQQATKALQEIHSLPRVVSYSQGNDNGLEQTGRVNQTLLTHALLLGGNWREAYRLATANNVLGWSSSENIQGLVLCFFLVWLSGKPAALPTALMKFWQEQLSSREWIYANENTSTLTKRLETAYVNLFGQVSLEVAQQNDLLAWCLEVANQRVDAIVGGQHRKSYDKAARLITACAEVLRLRGETSRGRALLADVRGRYPRHRAFLTEMDRVGGKGW